MVDELSEFQRYHGLVRTIEPLIRLALDELADRDHDILVVDYGLLNLGFELRNPERAGFISYGRDERSERAARIRFSRILERLVSDLATAEPDNQEIRQTLALIRGEDIVSSGLPSVLPIESSTLSAEHYKSGTIEIPADTRIIDFFCSNPEHLHLMLPREFEALTAEALISLGYLVRLGPLGRDGGVDIYAEKEGDLGTELILVQCKRYSPEHKVGEPIIKQLYTEVVDRRASRGLVVTSSYFTRTALKFIQIHKYQLDGVDRIKLLGWLESLRINSRSRSLAPNSPLGADRRATAS